MGTSTITSRNINRALTPEEKELINIQVELSRLQLTELRKQAAFTDVINRALPGKLAEEEAFNKSQRSLQTKRDALELQSLDAALQLQPLQKEIAKRELEALERGGQVDERTSALIDQIAIDQKETGFSNITARTERLIEQVSTQTAAGLGLRASDSPITDRLDVIGEAAVGERAALISQIEQEAAAAKFSVPLAQAQITSARGASLSGIINNATQLQSNAQFQDTANRRNSLTNSANLGLGLSSTLSRPGDIGLALQSNRIAQGGITQNTREDFNADVAAGIVGAVGSGLQAGQKVFFTDEQVGRLRGGEFG